MKITTSYANLISAMGTVNGVLADRLLQEDMKNIIFLVRNGSVRLVAYNFKISCFADVTDANVEWAEGEDSTADATVQLQAKDILAVLGVLKTLTCTSVKALEFNFTVNEAVLTVHEEPKDETIESADKYYQTSKYRLTLTRLKESIRKDILAQDVSNDTAISIEASNLGYYLNSLIPTVTSDSRDTVATRVNFASDFVYTVPHTYAALIKNKLDPAVSDFVLTSEIALFMRNFIGTEEYINFSRETRGEFVQLKLSNSYAVAIIKTLPISKAFKVTNFIEVPDSAIAVSRGYLTDVLRRVALNNEAADISINIDGGTFNIVCKKVEQDIPVVKQKGTGNFSFSMKADLLTTLIFSHVPTGEYVYFKLGFEEETRFVLAISDSTGNWHTKVKGLSVSKGGNNGW